MYGYLVITIALAILLPLLRVGRRPKGLPPGPPTVPVLGNVHLMPARDIHLQFQKWAKEYGPIYSLILGTTTMIVLSSDQAVVDLLEKRGAIYSDRGDHYLGGEILSQGNRLLFARYGPKWRMLHRVIHGLLNKQKSATYVPYQDLESKQMLFELLTDPDRFLDAVRRYAASLTTSMVYGFRVVTFDDPRMNKLYDVADNVTEITQSANGQLLEVFPILRNLPDFLFPQRVYAKACQLKEKDLYLSLWLNVKNNLTTAKPTFLSDMARLQEKEGFSDDLAAYTGGSLLGAGADTTSNTLYGFLQAMVLFPEVQKKAQREIDEVVGHSRLPEAEDYSRLPYIRSCVKEAVRWFPTAILAFPHAVMQNDEYMGYQIPKGAQIVNNAYTIAMDPDRHFNPRRFDPDRFEGSDLDLVESVTHVDPAQRPTFTFGAGRRICQGMHVAETSLLLGISRTLWAFDVVPAKDGEGNDMLPDPEEVTQGFVCSPQPFKAIIKPRSDEKAGMIRQIWTNAQQDLNPKSKEWRL